MTAAVTTPPRFDVGRVMSRMFGAIGRNGLVFGLLATAMMGIPELLLGVAQKMTLNGHAVASLDATTVLISSGSGALILLIFYPVLQAALMHGVVADLNGRRPGFGECVATGFRFFFPVIGITVLMFIALMFGFLFFIIPGVLMFLAWSVALPAEIVERTGVFRAFSRSADLTRNHRGPIFGLYMLFTIFSWILSAVVFGVSAGAMTTTMRISWAGIVVSAVVQVLQTLIGAAGSASIYYELRSIKEGIGPDELAAVFD